MKVFPCAHCGEMIPESAEFCKHCGSDHETGWNPDVDYYSVDLPEDAPQETPRGMSPVAKGARIVLVVVLILILSVACVADIGGVSRYAVGVLFFGWLLFVVYGRKEP